VLLLLRPYRCQACLHRFWALAWSRHRFQSALSAVLIVLFVGLLIMLAMIALEPGDIASMEPDGNR
jgi:hypothetical protein